MLSSVLNRQQLLTFGSAKQNATVPLMKRQFCQSLIFLLLPASMPAQNGAPVVDHFTAAVDWPTNTLTLHYDVSDPENDAMEVSVEFSNTGGKTYDLTSQVPVSGDVGFPVLPGNGRTITCDVSALINMGAAFTVRLVVDDRQPFDLQSLVNQVDSNRLRSDLAFVQGIRHRSAGAAHLAEVQDSLMHLFQAGGLFTDQQAFAYNGGYTGRNLSGTAPGMVSADSVVVVDAHYDTVVNAPGADDNGSGTVGVMEIARLLSRYPSRKTLRYIGFDLEEDGLVGSIQYVSSGIPANETITGVFNFEMIGYYSEMPNSQVLPPGFNLIFPGPSAEVAANQYRGDFITNVGAEAFSTLADLFKTSAATYVPDLKVITVIEPAGFQVLDLRRSDHAPFWVAGKPALMLTDGSEYRNTCYHKPCDTLENRLNFTFMSRVVKATLAAAAQLAGLQHGDWAVASFNGLVPVRNPLAGCPISIVTLPAGGRHIGIRFGGCPLTDLTLELYQLNGQLCHRERLTASPDPGWYEMEMPQRMSGVCLLRITAAQGSRTFKIVCP